MIGRMIDKMILKEMNKKKKKKREQKTGKLKKAQFIVFSPTVKKYKKEKKCIVKNFVYSYIKQVELMKKVSKQNQKSKTCVFCGNRPMDNNFLKVLNVYRNQFNICKDCIKQFKSYDERLYK